MKKCPVVIVFVVLLCLMTLPVTAQGDSPSAQIVLVADISNSMNTVDAGQYMVDALKLAVDLAPGGAQVSLVTVNDAVIYASELTETSAKEGRQALKKAIDQIQYTGNTNLGVGVQHAINILDSAEQKASARRIVLLSDITEGGLYLGESISDGEYSSQVSLLHETAERAEQNKIMVDLILVGTAPKADSAFAAMENLADQTGGAILQMGTSNSLPYNMESLFFATYTYNTSTIASVNSTGEDQIVSVDIPVRNARRARILLSAAAPVKGIQASQKGGALTPEINKSYSLLDIDSPEKQSLDVTVTPGKSDQFTAHVILDFDLELVVEEKSTATLPEDADSSVPAIQHTTLVLDIVDRQSGESVLDSDVWDSFSPAFSLTPPDGSDNVPVQSSYSEQDGIILEFDPDTFGTYTVLAQLSQGDIHLSPDAVEVDIPDMRGAAVLTEEKGGFALTEAIALAIGGVIIVAALLFVLLCRRPAATVPSEPVSPGFEGCDFAGKFDIYVICARGGEYEFPPMSFSLGRMSGKRKISLAEVLDGCNMQLTFEGAEKIWFYAGADRSILLKNGSKADIHCIGTRIGTGESQKLLYGQKFYVTFAQNEDEMEIHYRDSRDAFQNGHSRSYQMKS